MPVLRMLTLWVAKTFSKMFGLATITFFGRVPSRDDDKLGAVGLLAVTWPFAVVALAVPAAAELLIPFAPDDDTVLRAMAAALVLGIPVVVGLLINSVQNQPDGTSAALRNVVYGFGYTPVVALLVLALIVVVPLVKGKAIARRLEVQHLAVMVPEDNYDQLRRHIQELLAEEGVETELGEHPWLIRQLFAGLSWTEGHIFRRGMATKMQRLTGETDGGGFELTIHATDLSIVGKEEAVSAVFAVLAERMDPRVAYLSWDDRSQQIEDQIAQCRDQLDDGQPCEREHLAGLVAELRGLALSPPEWNAIRHQLYRVEIDSERLRADSLSERTASG